MGSQGGGFPRGRFGGGPGPRPGGLGREAGQPGDFSMPQQQGGGGAGGAGGGGGFGGPVGAGGQDMGTPQGQAGGGAPGMSDAGMAPGGGGRQAQPAQDFSAPQGTPAQAPQMNDAPAPIFKDQRGRQGAPGLQRPGNFGPGSFGGGRQMDIAQYQGGPGRLQGQNALDQLRRGGGMSQTMDVKPWEQPGFQYEGAQQDQQGPAPQQPPQPFKPSGQNRFKQANNPFRQQQTRVSQAQQAGMPSQPVQQGKTASGRPAPPPPQGVGQPAQSIMGPEAEQQKKKLPQGGGGAVPAEVG